MRKFVYGLMGVVVLAIAAGAQAPPSGARPAWAFLAPDKEQPPAKEEAGPIHVPGSAKAYTAAEIDNLSNPPDWYPDEHGPLPKVIQGGPGSTALACGSCHLMKGQGHPE